MYFLSQVAKDIDDFRKGLGEGDKERMVVVFPNKRSVRYFKMVYSSQIREHQFIRTLPWQQLLDSLLPDYQAASPLRLLVVLYDIFKQVMGQSRGFADMGFDEFYSLGQTILSDFNEIDNYLIDAQKIYLNIADLEQLTKLDFLSDEQLNVIKQFWSQYKNLGVEHAEFFVQLFSNLAKIYEKFTSYLRDNKLHYPGLRNRIIVERLEGGEDLFADYSYVALAGFYALSKSERSIFDYLKKSGKARFYWDYDHYYLSDGTLRKLGRKRSLQKAVDVEHEAGLFLDLNLPQYPDSLQIDRERLVKDTKVYVISAPRRVAQARILPQIFEQLGLKDNPGQLERTAVILLDEAFLFPVLYSLPDYVEKINVTLQFPLRLTALYSFFEAWFYVINHLKKGFKLYYKDLQQLLDTEIIQKIFPDLSQQLKQLMSQKRELYIALPDQLKQHIVFSVLNTQNSTEFLDQLLRLVYQIYKKSDQFEREYIYAVYTAINQLQIAIDQLQGFELSIDILLSLLRQYFYDIRVPFEGNSLRGLQIMTIMETRNLDFDNIIMLGLNEGIYPRISRPHSFLTESMRKFYGLPILKYQDSLYAYIFYRLLHHAKNVYLIYNSLVETGNEGKSRYILQLENETDLIKEQYTFTEDLVIPEFSFELKPENIQPLISQKKILSASALLNYLRCPRMFFLNNVLRLSVPQQEEFEIGVAEFGDILHSTLEQFYLTIKSQKNSPIIEAQDIEALKPKIPDFVEQAMRNIINQNIDMNSGDISMAANAIIAYANKVVEYDAQNVAPFEIVTLERDEHEKGYYYNFKVNENLTVTLQGIFDRIHKKDGIYYLLDYKTGKKNHRVTLDKLFDSSKLDYKSEPIFQLLIYYLIYKGLNPSHDLVLWLYDVPSMFKEKHNFSPEINVSNITFRPEKLSEIQEIIKIFEQNLRNLLEQIFSPDQKFPMTDNLKACDNCPFAQICGRL